MKFYLRTGIFGLIVYALCYGYLRWLNIPGELNKSAADTAIILIGLSMLVSSISYFFNFADWMMAYRKHLGLVGFAFALSHLALSWNPFLSLFRLETWQQGKMWPVFTGFLALLFFGIMALVSNSKAAQALGKHWRPFLRYFGYLAIVLVLAHVYLLKSSRWVTWFAQGMKTPPSLSLIVAIFITIVLLSRLVLWVRTFGRAK